MAPAHVVIIKLWAVMLCQHTDYYHVFESNNKSDLIPLDEVQIVIAGGKGLGLVEMFLKLIKAIS